MRILNDSDKSQIILINGVKIVLGPHITIDVPLGIDLDIKQAEHIIIK